jgi:hypothetical protein
MRAITNAASNQTEWAGCRGSFNKSWLGDFMKSLGPETGI